MWIYIHSRICLHGVVLNKLSTGANLPYLTTRISKTQDLRKKCIGDKTCLFLVQLLQGNKFGSEVYLLSLARSSLQIRAEKCAGFHVGCLSITLVRFSPELECVNKLTLVTSAYKNRFSHCLILVKETRFRKLASLPSSCIYMEPVLFVPLTELISYCW
jgi:hypothetical protein